MACPVCLIEGLMNCFSLFRNVLTSQEIVDFASARKVCKVKLFGHCVIVKSIGGGNGLGLVNVCCR